MKESQGFFKRFVTIFVWVWAVYSISVHLSSPESTFEIPRNKYSLPSSSCLDYLEKLLLPALLSLKNGEEYIQNSIAEAISRGEQTILSSFSQRRHFKKSQIKVAHPENKKVKLKNEQHACEEEEEEVEDSLLNKRRRKRKLNRNSLNPRGQSGVALSPQSELPLDLKRHPA